MRPEATQSAGRTQADNPTQSCEEKNNNEEETEKWKDPEEVTFSK